MERLVCKKFCPFYKQGMKRMKCGSYSFLERNLTHRELDWVAGRTPKKYDLSADKQIKSLVCEKNCGFYSTGDCDFRLGFDSPPCGGYAIMENLLKGVQTVS
jgi:hypothetical protein